MFNVKKLSLIVLVSVLVSLLVSSQIGNAGYIGDPDTVIRLNKFSLIPYKWAIEQFNATAYQSFNSTGYTIQSLDDQALIQACINDVTAVGGEILIVSGSYSASVTLKTNIRLVIEKGATGITVAIDAGATCVLEDYNNSITWYYSSGVLMLQYNNINGAIAGVYATFTEGHFSQLYLGGVNKTDLLNNMDCPVATASTFTLANSVAEQTLLEFNVETTNITEVNQLYLDLDALTKNCTLKVYFKIDGTNYRENTAMRLTNLGSADQLALVLSELKLACDMKVTITSIELEGATRAIPYVYILTVW